MRRRILHRAVRDEDIAEELQSQLAIEVARLMKDGLSREEAERRARHAFGNVGLIRETTREAWGSVWLERRPELLNGSENFSHSRTLFCRA
ncbi:MAG: permease prefix domain 1-containing protein [Bryobacteraceae bacterium]